MPPPVSDRRRRILSRGRWLLLVCPLLCLAIALATLPLRHRTYTAAGLTQVVTDNVAATLGVREDNGGLTPAQKNVRRFSDCLSDDRPGGFLDTAVRDAHLAAPINLDPAAADPRAGLLKKKLTANAQSDTLWAINLTWDDPTECAAIVTALRDQYRREIGEERAAGSMAARAFLESQIVEYGKRLDYLESLRAGAATLPPGDPTSAQRAREIRNATRDYPVLLALYRHLVMQRERQAFAARLNVVAGSASLTPVGYVRAEPASDPSDARRDALYSVGVGLLLAVLLLALARAGAAVAGSSRRERAVRAEAVGP